MISDNARAGIQQAPARSLFNALGFTAEEMKKPMVGIVSSYNEIVPGHMNLDKITEAVGKSANPANYLLAQKYIQTLQDIASGQDTKTVYLPYEATNLMGSIGGIKDLFKSE